MWISVGSEQNYHSQLDRIAKALEALVKLSTPEKVSPMVKKMAPLWPYADAPGAVGYTYGNRLAQLDPRNEGFTESQGVGVDTQPATS